MLFTPFGVQAMTGLFCFLLISCLLFYVLHDDRDHLKYDKKRKFYYSTKGTYGTAGWMEQTRMQKVFNLTLESAVGDVNEIVYGIKDGKVISRKPDSMLNQHIAVFGASGSMKSRAYARNAIISSAKSGESIVVTDPKAELLADTCGYLEDMGYTVMCLDLVNPARSDRFYGLDGVMQNPLYVSQIVEAIISNTGGGSGDQFFDAAEGFLLSALIFMQLENGSDELPTLGQAYKTLFSSKNLDELTAKFNELPEDSLARNKWRLFNMASDNLKGNVMIGLASRLQVLEHDEISELMAYPDMDFTRLGKEKTAYFLVLSDQDNTMRFVSAMFFSLLFMRLVHFADNECAGKKLPVGVNLILDEYCNLVGAIHSFNIKISTVRSRNIRISIICQSIGQIQNRHPDNLWSEIISNADTMLFLGCSDQLTAEYISERTGEITIGVDTTMRQRSLFMPFDLQPNYRQSEGAGRRMLLTPDEVLTMDIDKMLIILRGEQVLEADKFDYLRNPESGKFHEAPWPDILREISETIELPTQKAVEPPQEDSVQKPKTPRPKQKSRPRRVAAIFGEEVIQGGINEQLSLFAQEDEVPKEVLDDFNEETSAPDLT